MNNTYAVIVGIEKYDQPRWDLSGPCANAIAIGHWLISIGTPPGNIRAFIDPDRPKEKENDIAGLEREGVRIVRSGGFKEIDNFFHLHLPQDCPHGARLLVYWSGHGCTNTRGDRIFFCRDYQVAAPNRVFNASTFLRTLHAGDYRRFTDQIVLADVCGSYNSTPVIDSRVAPEQQQAVHQLACFATPEGKYAKGPNDRGVFTETVLTVLKQIGGWPAHTPLVEQLGRAFDNIGETPFYFRSVGDGHNAVRRVGTVVAGAGNTLFHSAFDLLQGLDVVDGVFLPHYMRTATDLGIPADAQGLEGIVRELSSLRDGELTKGVPVGLLQFLTRLSQEEALKQPLDQWLNEHAGSQKNTLAEIHEKLAVEAQRKILVILVRTSDKRDIATFEPHLRNSHHMPVPNGPVGVRPVASWPDFERQLQQLLTEFVVDGRLQDLEIHFLADPPLFDRPFHRIPLVPGGPPIGQQAVVILRHRLRVLSSSAQLDKDWNDYAATLRKKRPRQIRWLKVECGPPLPAEKGLCYAAFVLPPAHEGGAACENEKLLLGRLLDLGAPYVCLPHVLPAGAGWPAFEKDLKSLSKGLPTIDRFPDKFRAERLRGSELALHASILWDDPLAKPFRKLEGVRTP